MSWIQRIARGGRLASGVALIALLAGCQESDPPSTEAALESYAADAPEAPLQTTAAPTTTTTTEPEAPVSYVVAQGFVGDTDALSDGHNVSGDIATLRRTIPVETAITAGSTLTVTFSAGAPHDDQRLCSLDHFVDVEEDGDVVAVQVTQLLILAPDAAVRDCPAISDTDENWALTVDLVEPVDGRRVVDQVAGSSLFIAEEEARLVPTWLPEGWTTLRDDNLLPLRTLRYVSATQQILVFQSAPISAGYRISDHRRDAWWEPTTVRNPDDGVFLSLEDRRTNVTFEEQGWYYKVNSTADVDPSVVLEFIRSFERPALIGPDLDPRLVPREVLGPQPGQEDEQ